MVLGVVGGDVVGAVQCCGSGVVTELWCGSGVVSRIHFFLEKNQFQLFHPVAWCQTNLPTLWHHTVWIVS